MSGYIEKSVIGPTRPPLKPAPRPDYAYVPPSGVTWTDSSGRRLNVVPAGRINRVGRAAEDRQLTLAADNAPIRLIYGRDRIGGQVLNLLLYQDYLYVQLLWGYQLDSVESVTFNGTAVSENITNYTGSQSTVDPWLQAAFAGQSPAVTYTDTLAGFAYTVIRMPKAKFTGGVEFAAVVKGRKVYDSRKDSTNGGSGTHRLATPSTWEYSTNPSLILADFLKDAVYGESRTLDWASVAAAATWNDTLIGSPSEKHRILDGLTIDQVQDTAAVRDTLATYAGVWLAPRGATVYFVQDKTRTYDTTYAHASGELASVDRVEKADMTQAPTLVEVWYTDTTSTPWRERPARSDAVAGETVRRLSSVRLPGIQRHSQARREATERLNKLNLSDLSMSITVWDKGIAHELGDVVRVTLPFGGITAKDMRVVAPPALSGAGQWQLTLAEYDAAAYSTEVVAGPSYPDTTLGDPNNIGVVTSLAMTEEVYRSNAGVWLSRGWITWDAPSPSTWIDGFEIEIRQGDRLLHSGYVAYTPTPQYRTPPLPEAQTYTVWVRAMGTVGAAGAWNSYSHFFGGKLTPPSNVPSLAGFCRNGTVYLSWQPATDVDLWRYEIRRDITSGSWDAAPYLVDRVDGLSLQVDGVPAGTWRFFIKALDSVGNYSASATTVDVVVDVDRDSMLIEFGRADFYSNASSSLVSYSVDGRLVDTVVEDSYPMLVADRGTSVSAAFATTPLSSSYPNAMSSYTGAGTSTYNTPEPRDLGIAVAGIWTIETPGLTVISGSATVKLKAKVNSGDAWTEITSFPHRGAYRYFTVSITSTGTFKIEERASIAVKVLADVKREFGLVTASAVAAATVTLTGKYIRFRSLILTPYGASSARARVATYANLTLSESGTNSFDVYLYDGSGSRVGSEDVAYSFEGI